MVLTAKIVEIFTKINKKVLSGEISMEEALRGIISNLPAQIAEIFSVAGQQLERQIMVYLSLEDSEIKVLSKMDLQRIMRENEANISDAIQSFRGQPEEPTVTTDSSGFRESFYNLIAHTDFGYSFTKPTPIDVNLYEIKAGSATAEVTSFQDIRSAIIKNIRDCMKTSKIWHNQPPNPLHLIAYEKLHLDILPSSENGLPRLHNMLVIPLVSSEDNRTIGVFRLLNCFKMVGDKRDFLKTKGWFKDEIIEAISSFSVRGLSRLVEKEIFQSKKVRSDKNFVYLHNLSYPCIRSTNVIIAGSLGFLSHIDDAISKAALSDTAVLISGETGTGKELIARAIHDNSRRSSARFEAINCGSLDGALLESRLFGHERGAFTGAVGRKIGTFEIANGGTIFLDEAQAMPEETQVKLLRFLQFHKIRRVGGLEDIDLDLRIIATVNDNPSKLVKEKKWRKDLNYRLNVLPIRVPPLRERQDDIPYLIKYFMKSIAGRMRIENMMVEEGIFDKALYENLHFTGNIREIESFVERSLINYFPSGRLTLNNWLSILTPDGNDIAHQAPERKYDKKLILKQHSSSRSELFTQSGVDRILSDEIGFTNYLDILGRDIVIAEANGIIQNAAELNGESPAGFTNNCRRRAEKLISLIKENKFTGDELAESIPNFYSQYIEDRLKV